MRLPVIFAAVLLLAPVAAQAGEVAGTVYDARGRAAAGVELALGGQRTVSGADGSYRFSEVPAGEHRVVTGAQAVAVTVAEEGETRRNVMLLARSARTAVTGSALAPAEGAALVADAMRLADAMLAEAAAMPSRRLADIDG